MGAAWVTNRVPKLMKVMNLTEDQVHVVVDFYHAVEHVKAAAETQKKWTGNAEEKAWIKKLEEAGCIESEWPKRSRIWSN